MKAATMISSERTRETLEALLSTPISSREIISQKVAGLHRLMIVLSIPILTIHLTLLLMHFDIVQIVRSLSLNTLGTILFYAIMVTVTTYTSMHLVVWLSALMGLRSPTQARSVMAAITVLGVWVAGSAFLLTPGEFGYSFGLSTLSPLFGIQDQGFSENFILPGQGWDPRDEIEQQAKIERLMATMSSVCCLMRPDGSIWANESILASNNLAGISKTAPFYAFSKLRSTAAIVSLTVLSGHILMMLCFRGLTLTLAPRLLQRLDDGIPMNSPLIEKPSATLISEGAM
jgi:ABC-type transport system involved in multi-copper enzyme maturation permease subunit